MKIIPCGSVQTIVAPDVYFTGRVLQTPIIEKEAPARLRATMVQFEPGARTAWHTHPLGQTLFVVSGAGRAQSWGEPVFEIRPAM
jgi:quercetin dioxygenase-like cupin family protein